MGAGFTPRVLTVRHCITSQCPSALSVNRLRNKPATVFLPRRCEHDHRRFLRGAFSGLRGQTNVIKGGMRADPVAHDYHADLHEGRPPPTRSTRRQRRAATAAWEVARKHSSWTEMVPLMRVEHVRIDTSCRLRRQRTTRTPKSVSFQLRLRLLESARWVFFFPRAVLSYGS